MSQKTQSDQFRPIWKPYGLSDPNQGGLTTPPNSLPPITDFPSFAYNSRGNGNFGMGDFSQPFGSPSTPDSPEAVSHGLFGGTFNLRDQAFGGIAKRDDGSANNPWLG